MRESCAAQGQFRLLSMYAKPICIYARRQMTKASQLQHARQCVETKEHRNVVFIKLRYVHQHLRDEMQWNGKVADAAALHTSCTVMVAAF